MKGGEISYFNNHISPSLQNKQDTTSVVVFL